MLLIRIFLVILCLFNFYNANTEQLNIDQAVGLQSNILENLSPITQFSTDQAVVLQSNISENLLPITQFREELPEYLIPSKLKMHEKKRIYASFSGGKTYNDNSETFINGIQAIGDRVLSIIEGNSWSPIIKNILTGEINTISQFDGKIKFQWLGNTSLGCYIGKNGRIDAEIMSYDINILDNKYIFDKSASIFAFLLNLSYSPQIKDTKFTPYFSLGIGPTVFRLKRVNKKAKAMMPLNLPWYSYQMKFGIDYSITQDCSVFLGYRYFNIPMPITNNISTHNVEAGIRLHF